MKKGTYDALLASAFSLSQSLLKNQTDILTELRALNKYLHEAGESFGPQLGVALDLFTGPCRYVTPPVEGDPLVFGPGEIKKILDSANEKTDTTQTGGK